MSRIGKSAPPKSPTTDGYHSSEGWNLVKIKFIGLSFCPKTDTIRTFYQPLTQTLGKEKSSPSARIHFGARRDEKNRRFVSLHLLCGCGGMVDALVSGTSVARRGGSSPLIRTS